jgi:hypothetical protein
MDPAVVTARRTTQFLGAVVTAGGMDLMVVTARRMTWFLGKVLTAGRRGPSGSDSRADGMVPRCGGDSDGGGGGREGSNVVPIGAHETLISYTSM